MTRLAPNYLLIVSVLLVILACGEKPPAPIKETTPTPTTTPVETTPPEPVEPQPEPEPEPPALPQTGVFGTVMSLDGQPVEGANVRLFNEKGQEQMVVSNGFGHFHFPEPEPGSWQIEAASVKTVSFTAKEDIPTLEVNAEGTYPQPLELNMTEAAQLLVRVLSRHKRIPLEDAKIRIGHLHKIFETNEKGEVNLNLSPGIWNLEISAPYHKAQRAMVGFSMTPKPFEASLAPEGKLPESLETKAPAPYDLQFESIEMINGTVVDKEGDPIIEARIATRSSQTDPNPKTHKTGLKGKFRFRKPENLQGLVFSAPGYVSHHHTGPWDESLEITLQKLITFHGRVLDATDDQPLTVFRLNKNDQNQGTEIRNQNGLFALEKRHPQDPIYLTLTAEGYQFQKFGPFEPDSGPPEKPVVLRLEPEAE